MEGFTMLAAAAVLIFVGFWLIAKVEVHRWKAFVATQAQRAVKSGSAIVLASAAFLAVYREGFETVLFYKALLITSDGQGIGLIVAGAVVATVALIAVYLAVERFGMRLPLRSFFAVTSAGLLYLAFAFAGRGIAELQESALIHTTFIEWMPRVPWLGVYPTMEALLLQSAIVSLIVFGLTWTFMVRPRPQTAPLPKS